jgi:hypothetical protein
LGSSWILSAVLCAGVFRPAPAAAADTIPNTAAWRSNTGMVTGLGFAILIPSEGNVGVGADFSARYGVPAGPVILAPGALIGGYYLQSRFIGALMVTGRATVPLGVLAPFAEAGIGPGFLTNPGDGGAAWRAGGGLDLYLGIVTLGVEVDYQAITGTPFQVWTIGPTIGIGG